MSKNSITSWNAILYLDQQCPTCSPWNLACRTLSGQEIWQQGTSGTTLLPHSQIRAGPHPLPSKQPGWGWAVPPPTAQLVQDQSMPPSLPCKAGACPPSLYLAKLEQDYAPYPHRARLRPGHTPSLTCLNCGWVAHPTPSVQPYGAPLHLPKALDWVQQPDPAHGGTEHRPSSLSDKNKKGLSTTDLGWLALLRREEQYILASVNSPALCCRYACVIWNISSVTTVRGNKDELLKNKQTKKGCLPCCDNSEAWT